MRARRRLAAAGAVLALGSAGFGMSQAAAAPCVITDGPKYSTPGDAASAQYVDMGTQCVDPGIAGTQVTVTPTKKPASKTPTRHTSTGSTPVAKPPASSAGVTRPTVTAAPPAATTSSTPSRTVTTHPGSRRNTPATPRKHATAPLTAAPDAAPLVAAALSASSDERGLRVGTVTKAAETAAGIAVIIAMLAAASLSLRRFIRNRPSRD